MQRHCLTLEYARIRVVGIGGGGVTAVNKIIQERVIGVDYLTVDTDSVSIRATQAINHIKIGPLPSVSEGSGGDWTAGYEAAAAAEEKILEKLDGSDIVFVLAGLGGGTGSGAAPIIARLAKQAKALVIGIVTFPFTFEGDERARTAKLSVEELRGCTDTLVVIPNDRLLHLSNGKIGFHETYRLAHNIWCESIRSLSDLINRSGLINLDYADIRTIMHEGGAAIITTGKGCGPERAQIAAAQACRSDILGITLDGAQGLLFNVIGGPDLTLGEVEDIAYSLTQRVNPNANVIFGAAVDETLGDELRIIAIGTGFGLSQLLETQPTEIKTQKLPWTATRKPADSLYSVLPA